MLEEFSEEQIDRYARHIILEEVGGEGQKELLESSVLCVGAGGLGSPTIYYLAAAGVGRIGIVDDDVVESSNLQRQIIHSHDDVGRPKAVSAKESVEALNPDVTVDVHETRLNNRNVMDLIGEYDFVIDGSDNFETRFLVNDACTITGTPYNHGSIFKFEGQVITFPGDGGSCYRCLFPEAPPSEMVPSCSAAGVLGVLPGTVGAIQATEAVKHILGIGEVLDGRMLYFDSLGMDFHEVEVKKNPKCPVCGDEPTITDVEDVEYAEVCSV